MRRGLLLSADFAIAVGILIVAISALYVAYEGPMAAQMDYAHSYRNDANAIAAMAVEQGIAPSGQISYCTKSQDGTLACSTQKCAGESGSATRLVPCSGSYCKKEVIACR